MALLSSAQAKQIAASRYPNRFTKTAGRILSEVASVPIDTSFDIFLSYSYSDAQAISDEEMLGVKGWLEQVSYTVYVDWITDHQLDRTKVNSETAELLRKRMTKCRSLFFVTSQNSSSSKWMPWELGYMDGKKATAAVLPLSAQVTTSDKFVGQEYLGIYPYFSGGNDTNGVARVWIHKSETVFSTFEEWLKGKAK